MFLFGGRLRCLVLYKDVQTAGLLTISFEGGHTRTGNIGQQGLTSNEPESRV